MAAAGFTAIELMPVADFFGRWNWGYDGVLLYAPDSAYGRPEDLKALIDAAHQRGLMVFLDVVYNHFGPEGNYLGRYAPQFFCKADTPWGNAIDYENPHVRRFAVENALLLARRLSLRRPAARRGACDHRAGAEHSAEGAQRGGRPACVGNRTAHSSGARKRRQPGEPARSDSRSAAGQIPRAVERRLSSRLPCAADRRDRGLLRRLSRAGRVTSRATLAEGFVYQGEPSPHRKGEPRGEPTSALPATAFVNFLQNHDQIGNRALGERLSVLAQPAALEAALAVTLLAPAPPLMFMGDEWGAREPFPFFCDFKGDLAEAVRNGRRKEFAEAYARDHDDVPDPLSEQTVRLAKLDWTAIEQAANTVRGSISCDGCSRRAKSFIIPRLPHLQPGPAMPAFADGVLTAQWTFASGETLSMLANLSEQVRTRPGAFRNEQAGLGRRAAGGTAAVVGLCRDRGRVVPWIAPLSTYRLQLSKDFGFDDAARIVPYLKSLGITHLYTSPFLKARPGSLHGYDAVDYGALNPEFGGEEAFARLSAALKSAGLGLILDFVPNHMAVGSDNAWWMDVLEWGQKSPRAASFDISWELLPYRHGGGVLLPVLGKPYGDALTGRRDRAEIRCRRRAASPPGISITAFRSIRSAIATSSRPSSRPRMRPTSRPDARCIALADENARPGLPSYAQAPALKQRLAGIDGAAPIIERGLVGLPRRPRGRRQRAAPPAGAAALSPRRLAARGVRHQLPALFRHQRAGRACGSRTRGRSATCTSLWRG